MRQIKLMLLAVAIFVWGKSSIPTQAAEAQPNLPYKYLGNRQSLKFHRPRCPFAQIMSRSKRHNFHFRRQAIEAGYHPCRYCLPPYWTSVSVKLLNKPD